MQFGIEIQSKILLLIVNRISIFTKTLRYDTFGEYLLYTKRNFFVVIEFHSRVLILVQKKKMLKKVCEMKLTFMSIFNI